MSISAMKKSVVFFALFLIPVVSCSDILNEYIPTRKLLESVVNVKIKPAEDKQYEAGFMPEYSGRYVIYLVLKQRGGIDVVAEKFSLAGTFQVQGRNDVLIVEGDFNKTISSRNTGSTLSRFEIDRKQADNSEVFQIVFSEGTEQLNQYYSEITLHVKKKLKHSLFD